MVTGATLLEALPVFGVDGGEVGAAQDEALIFLDAGVTGIPLDDLAPQKKLQLLVYSLD